MGNPVDTSLSVSNWSVGFGADGRKKSPEPPPYPGSFGSTAAQAKSHVWITQSARLDSRLRKKKGLVPLGADEFVVISNPVDYVPKLNWEHRSAMGWVTSAPVIAMRMARIEWKA